MNDSKIDVSFIVPTKNEEDNIVRCIESLLACENSGLNVEICVVDNGSTDSTASIAREFGVNVFEHSGVSISALRNIGVEYSRGTWIAFIDADVTIERDWLQHAIREIREPGVAAVGASPSIPPDSNWVVRTWHLQIGARPDHGERQWLASMNMLVSRDVFEKVGGFDETLVTCEDVDLGYRMSKNYKIIYDKRIRAVHYGEAQTLSQLFTKEAWRGSFNYRGLLRHGWQPGELPSLSQPILTFCGMLALISGIVTVSWQLIFIGFAVFTLFPAAKSLQTVFHTRSWSSLPALFIVWSTYSVARLWSALLEMRILFLKYYDSRA